MLRICELASPSGSGVMCTCGVFHCPRPKLWLWCCAGVSAESSQCLWDPVDHSVILFDPQDSGCC